MELEVEKLGTVTKSQDFEATQFTIKATAHSFKILSSGMYSNKIRAIIRELSTNAYDSHVQAGLEEKPFDIYFPNEHAPFFKIRDYGISIAHEDVQEVYCSFFGSTKTSTNKLNGAFGLGSKAFFAYVHSANISTYIDGVQRLYVAMLSEEGLPTLNYLGECETTEANGLEVQLPVARSDYNAFTYELSVLDHFPTKPRVFGIRGFSWEDREKAYSSRFYGENWKVRTDTNRQTYAVMGYIAYPIDAGKLDRKAYTFLDKWRSTGGLEILFNIGDFSITPSREQISYDARSIKVISDALLEIEKQISEKVKSEVGDQTSLVALCNLWEKENNCFIRDSIKKIGFRGKDWISSYINTHLVDEKFVEYASDYSYRTGRWKITKDDVNTFSLDQLRKREFFIEDVHPNTSNKLIKSYLLQKSLKSNNTHHLVLIREPTTYTKHSTWETIGFPTDNIRYISELQAEYVEEEKAVRAATSTVLQLNFSTYDNSTDSAWWTEQEVDRTEGGFWIPINAFSLYESTYTSLSALNGDAIAVYQLENEQLPKVIGVRKKEQAKFEKDPLWKRFDLELTKRIESLHTDENLLMYNNYLLYDFLIGLMFGHKIKDLLNMFKYATLTGAGGHLLRQIQALDLNTDHNYLDKGANLHNFLRRTATVDSFYTLDTKHLRLMIDALSEKYPLLPLILNSRYSLNSIEQQHITQYIKDNS